MIRGRLARLLAAAVLGAHGAASATSAATDDDPVLGTPSPSFQASLGTDVEVLIARHFERGLRGPGLGASAGGEPIDAIARRINAPQRIEALGRGDAAVTYDIILQPGHFKRTSDRTGTSGRLVSERELVAYIVARMSEQLRAQGRKVLVVSADDFLRPGKEGPSLHAKVFLAVHADGNVTPCTGKASLAYAGKESTLAMHAVGWALAQALGYRYDEFARDGYTPAEARYYMFSQVSAPTLDGLLEVGELTCVATEERLVRSADAIAHNLSQALMYLTSL